jgi:hypothetical protein
VSSPIRLFAGRASARSKNSPSFPQVMRRSLAVSGQKTGIT